MLTLHTLPTREQVKQMWFSFVCIYTCQRSYSFSLSFFRPPPLSRSLSFLVPLFVSLSLLLLFVPPPLSLSCSFAPLSLGHLLSLSHAFLRMPLYLSKRECNFIYIYGIKIITNSPAMNQIFRFVLQILYAIRKTCIFFNKCEPSSVFTSFAVH